MKNFNWGIIGPGKIADDFSEDLKLVDKTNHQISAVVSYKIEKAERFAELKSAPQYFDSIHDFVKHGNVDAVYVSTPHPMHHKETLICLKNGIPVLCEKPMAMNYEQVKEMTETSVENNIFLMEGMWIRFLPSIEKMLEIIEKGEIGEVREIEASLSFVAPRDKENRFFNPDRGGGSLLDLGIYPLYLAQLLLGHPKKIQASAELSKEKIDHECLIVASYKDGQKAISNSSLMRELPDTAVIRGTLGTITIAKQWNEKPPEIKVAYRDGREEVHALDWEGRGFQYEISEVEECIRAGKIMSPKMSHGMSQELAATMDEVRRQCGIIYPFD